MPTRASSQCQLFPLDFKGHQPKVPSGNTEKHGRSREKPPVCTCKKIQCWGQALKTGSIKEEAAKHDKPIIRSTKTAFKTRKELSRSDWKAGIRRGRANFVQDFADSKRADMQNVSHYLAGTQGSCVSASDLQPRLYVKSVRCQILPQLASKRQNCLSAQPNSCETGKLVRDASCREQHSQMALGYRHGLGTGHIRRTRVKPLDPVDVTGPNISQCCGVVPRKVFRACRPLWQKVRVCLEEDQKESIHQTSCSSPLQEEEEEEEQQGNARISGLLHYPIQSGKSPVPFFNMITVILQSNNTDALAQQISSLELSEDSICATACKDPSAAGEADQGNVVGESTANVQDATSPHCNTTTRDYCRGQSKQQQGHSRTGKWASVTENDSQRRESKHRLSKCAERLHGVASASCPKYTTIKARNRTLPFSFAAQSNSLNDDARHKTSVSRKGLTAERKLELKHGNFTFSTSKAGRVTRREPDFKQSQLGTGGLISSTSPDITNILIPKLDLQFTPDNSVDAASYSKALSKHSKLKPESKNNGLLLNPQAVSSRGLTFSTRVLERTAGILKHRPTGTELGQDGKEMQVPAGSKQAQTGSLDAETKACLAEEIVDLSISFQGKLLGKEVPAGIPKIFLTEDEVEGEED